MFQSFAKSSAIDRRFKFAITGQAGGETCLACSHGIALPGDGERRSTRAAKVAGNQRKVVDRGHGHRALRRVIHTHGPTDKGGLSIAVEASGVHDVVL